MNPEKMFLQLKRPDGIRPDIAKGMQIQISTTSNRDFIKSALSLLLDSSRIMVRLYDDCFASMLIGTRKFGCLIDTGASAWSYINLQMFEMIKNERISVLLVDESLQHRNANNSVFTTNECIKIDFIMGGQCFRNIKFVFYDEGAKVVPKIILGKQLLQENVGLVSFLN